MNIAIIVFVSVAGGGLLSILGAFLYDTARSKVKEEVKEEEKSMCLDFFYTREKENDTLQEVRFYYKYYPYNSYYKDYLYNRVTPATYFTHRSCFKNKEALRHYIDQACENRDWKFEFTDYEVDCATGLPIEKEKDANIKKI